MKTDSARKVLPLTQNMTGSASVARTAVQTRIVPANIQRSQIDESKGQVISAKRAEETNFDISIVTGKLGNLTPEDKTVESLRKLDQETHNPILHAFLGRIKDLPSQAKVKMHKIIFVPKDDNTTVLAMNLVEVTRDGKKMYYELNKDGGHYASLEEFIKNNKFGPGKYSFYDERLKTQNNVERKETNWEIVRPWTDGGALILTVAATGTVILFPPSALVAGAVLNATGIYFGVTAGMDVQDDLNHGRFSLSTAGNIGMIVASAIPFGGAATKLFGIAGKASVRAAAAGGKSLKIERTLTAVLKFTGIAGNAVAIGSFTAEQALALKEIGEEKGITDEQKNKKLLYAVAQMLGNTALIYMSKKAGDKITQYKEGMLPQEAMPSRRHKLEVDRLLTAYYKNIWDKTVTKGKETTKAIRKFCEKGGAGAKDYIKGLYAETAFKLKTAGSSMKEIAKSELKKLEAALIIFSHENNMPLIPEEVALIPSTVEGLRLGGPSLLKLRTATKKESDSARVLLAASPFPLASHTSLRGLLGTNVYQRIITSIKYSDPKMQPPKLEFTRIG